MKYMNLLRYVRKRKLGTARTAKVEYRLTEAGLVRALTALTIDKYSISRVARYHQEELKPIFSTWRAFERIGLTKRYLGIVRSIFDVKDIGAELLRIFEPVELEVRSARLKVHPNELRNVPSLVVALFLMELGRRTDDPKVVSLIAKEENLFKPYLQVFEQVRLDQLFYAKLFHEREFRVVEMRKSLDLRTPPVLPQLPDTLNRSLERALSQESKRKGSQRYVCRQAFDILDKYVLRV